MGNVGCCRKTDPDSVGGRSMIYLPFFIRSRIIDSIEIAEKLCGQAPNVNEIYVVSVVHYKSTFPFGQFNFMLQNLYREDLFYANQELTRWSTNKDDKPNFCKFSQHFLNSYPGYVLDNSMRIRAKPETPVLNLSNLMYLLKSKDRKLWEECSWMLSDTCDKYLDGANNKSNKIAIASFPVQNNPLTKYATLLTGVQIGRDSSMDGKIQKGQDVVDDSVFIVHTNWPWCVAKAVPFKCQKIICFVRNPMEMIPEWLNLVNAVASAPFVYAQQYPNWWQKQIEKIVGDIRRWYDTVIHLARTRDVPTIFIRYEDLIKNPRAQLELIMQFITGLDDIQGTNAQLRVKQILDEQLLFQDDELLQRSQIFQSWRVLFSADQTEFVKKELEQFMYFFGYAKIPNDPDNFTGFFQYDKVTNERNQKHYQEFKATSNSVVQWVSTLPDEILSEFQYQMSDFSKDVNLLDHASQEIMVRPTRNWYERQIYDKAYTDCN